MGGRIEAKQKEPWLAFGLSFLIPGAGQFYNGQYNKGVTQLGATILGFGLIGSAVADDYENRWGQTVDPDDDDGKAVLGTLLWLGSHLWSMVDAPISADRINQQSEKPYFGHLMEFDGDRVTLGIGPVVQPNRSGARLTLHF